MCAEKRLIFVVSAAVLLTVSLGYGRTQRTPVSDDFLHCLCMSFTGCNTSIGCVEVVCGPYQITIGYWKDAGKPTLKGDTGIDAAAYTRCVNDIKCSARTVRQYMEKHATDCNSDGKVDAEDYFIIHKHGAWSCPVKRFSPEYDTFKDCTAEMEQQDTRDRLIFT